MIPRPQILAVLLATVLLAACTKPASATPPRARVWPSFPMLAADSLRVVTPISLPPADLYGPLDSVKVSYTGPVSANKKLLRAFGSTWSDTLYAPTPPPDQAYTGAVCVTLFRGTKMSQQCAGWSFTGPNAPPPLAVVGPITVVKIP
jgi:hypothetical protein